jgi:LysR family transcriptional regulator of beta-lactamase
MQLPLNALRMFDAAARHLSLTRAAQELHVTQAAVSQHIRNLEERLGKPLFRRLPRGLALTDEGQALWPVVAQSFERIEQSLQQVAEPRPREILTVGVVGTFAIGWLIPRLSQFQQLHPYIDLRLLTNNNRVDLAGEGLDAAVRLATVPGMARTRRCCCARRSRPCAPHAGTAAARACRPGPANPAALLSHSGMGRLVCRPGPDSPLARGAMFDSSLTLAEAAAQGAGIALLPARMFEHMLQQGRLVRPFAHEVDTGAYWLTYLKSRQASSACKPSDNG